MVVVDDESVAKMGGGDVDVKPSLSCQNALGNRNRNSNSQSKIGPKLSEWEVVRDGGAMWY